MLLPPSTTFDILYEYLLLISPIGDIESEIRRIKKCYLNSYGINAARSLPHITLIKFIQFETMQNLILSRFAQRSKSISPFLVEINGFGEYRKTNVIYARINNTRPIIDIVKGIRSRFRNILTADSKFDPKFCTSPHITIAKDMAKEEHARVWDEWKDIPLNGSFQATEMILLRRNLGTYENGNYHKVATFIFEGNPIPVQTSLFE